MLSPLSNINLFHSRLYLRLIHSRRLLLAYFVISFQHCNLFQIDNVGLHRPVIKANILTSMQSVNNELLTKVASTLTYIIGWLCYIVVRNDEAGWAEIKSHYWQFRATSSLYQPVIIMPPRRGIKRWCVSDVCLSADVWRLSRTSGLSQEQRGLGRPKLAQR